MNDERKINNYAIERSFHVGSREVVLGVDETQDRPFAKYFTPMDRRRMYKTMTYKDYLNAMSAYCERCTEQVRLMQDEQRRFSFDPAPFTARDCVPCPRDESIVGKVVVMDVSGNRREYQHPAYQLVLAACGSGAESERGNSVIVTCLATDKCERWERYDILGEIKLENLHEWTKKALEEIQKKAAEKASKKAREAR